MIPKKIHYCWFGGNPLNEMALKCIESWKKYFPDYEIIRWDESNFDVNACDYTREAYQAQKWAFISDYARFVILYEYGGLYFDTDVEVIKPMDDLIEKGAFMGCEKEVAMTDGVSSDGSGFDLGVNPGLGFGGSPGLGVYKEIIEDYQNSHFYRADGTSNTVDTVVVRTTRALVRHGLMAKNNIQEVAGVYVYPKDYFAPKDVLTHELIITENTRSIHHYDASWAEWYERRAGERGIRLRKLLGDRIGNTVNVAIYVVQKYGIWGCIKKLFSTKGKV